MYVKTFDQLPHIPITVVYEMIKPDTGSWNIFSVWPKIVKKIPDLCIFCTIAVKLLYLLIKFKTESESAMLAGIRNLHFCKLLHTIVFTP